MRDQLKIGHGMLLALLIGVVAGTTLSFAFGHYLLGLLGLLLTIVLFTVIRKQYNRITHNTLLLLNAIENRDNSFRFSERRGAKKEKALNKMLNHIKEMLERARQEEVENEQFLHFVLDHIATGVIIVDANSLVRFVNPASLQLLGLPIFTHINQLSKIDAHLPKLFSDLQPKHSTQIRINNEREVMQLSLQAAEMVLKKGVMKVITISNIGSELEARETESWIRLIRVMTHEIMNSVAPIASLSEVLLQQEIEKADDEEEKPTLDALQTIHTTTQGLIGFVESYRKFTAIPSPQKEPLALRPLIEQVSTLMKQQCLEKGVEITLHEQTGEEQPPIEADPSQIKQVVLNLMKNAVEASSANSHSIIQVRIQNDEGRVKIEICNPGEAISEEITQNMFVPFFTTKQDGNGIGLSLSRYIMRLHGGNLSYRYHEGNNVFSMSF